MSRTVLRSVSLHIVLPAAVLVIFVLLIASLYYVQEAQWLEYFDRTKMSSVRNEMTRLQRLVDEALSEGMQYRAEREIANEGAEMNVEALAALNESGHVMFATRQEWRGHPAEEVLPGFDAAVAKQVLEQQRSTMIEADDKTYITGYYLISLLPKPHSLRPLRSGILFMRYDLRGGHEALVRFINQESIILWYVALSAMLLLMVVLRRFVSHPIKQLAAAAADIAHGTAEPFVVRGAGEVASLGKAFNDAAMVARQLMAELRDSESRYRTIVDHAGLGIMLVDRNRHMLEDNSTIRQWFPAARNAEHCHEIFGNDPASPCRFCEMDNAYSLGGTVETTAVATVEGRARTLRIITSPVRDANGEINACVEIMEDISEQAETRRSLAKATRALRALSACRAATVRARSELELLQEVCDVIVVEGGYRMAWIGRALDTAERIISPVATAGGAKAYLHEVQINWSSDDFGRGPTGTAIRDLRPVVFNDIEVNADFSPWRKAAREFGFAAVAAIPLIFDDHVYGALTIYAREADAFTEEEMALLLELVESITAGMQALHAQHALQVSQRELQRLNAELERRVDLRTEELERINRELESFTYSVSHDLRAPLRAIDGFSQILVDRHAANLEPQAVDYLQRVRKATLRMGVLIDDLLGLSRINRYDLRMESVDLSALAAAVIHELREGEPQRRVEVVVEPGLVAVCDARLARIVLDNLLGNAWKYTGGVDGARIEFGAWQDEAGSGFVVRDNGVGFDMKYANKLFVPFQRLHSGAQFSGSGIGLATVLRALERSGGRIRAESAPGKGAAFFFCFGCEDTTAATSREATWAQG